MDEPERLSKGGDLGAQLLQGAKGYRVSSASRAQTLLALGAAGAPTLLAAKAGAAAVLGTKFWAVVGIGATVAGVGLFALLPSSDESNAREQSESVVASAPVSPAPVLVPTDSNEAAEDDAAESQLDRTRGSEEIELEAEQLATQRPASQPPSAM
jgi:hypothetical protein